jgi:hypothetical protein
MDSPMSEQDRSRLIPIVSTTEGNGVGIREQSWGLGRTKQRKEEQDIRQEDGAGYRAK